MSDNEEEVAPEAPKGERGQAAKDMGNLSEGGGGGETALSAAQAGVLSSEHKRKTQAIQKRAEIRRRLEAAKEAQIRAVKVQDGDAQVIMDHFEIPEAVAVRSLQEQGGDLDKALRFLLEK